MALVAASGDGNAPSTAANRKNNGGTLLNVGSASITSGPITNKLTVQTLATDVGVAHGSKVLVNDGTGAATTDRVGIMQPYATAALAYTPSATEWIMRGGNVTTTITGSGNTVLAGGGSDWDGAVRDNIHQLNNTQVLGSGGGTFDMLAVPSTNITPNFTKGGGAGNSQNFVAPSGDGNVTAVDNAAAPSRAVPGELTYHFGATANPTTDEYKAKDVYES